MNRRIDCVPPGVERLCDFCSAVLFSRGEGAGCLYPADDTQILETADERLMSEGDWWACAGCAALIDADDRMALAGRAVTQIAAKNTLLMDGTDAAFLFAVVRHMHDSFFAARRRYEDNQPMKKQSMTRDEIAWLEAQLSRNREGMEGSQVFLQLWEPEIREDPIAVLQTGLAVLLDKPFVFVVPPGHVLPENLRRLARRVIVRDIKSADDREALVDEIRIALESLDLLEKKEEQ